jgi:hypothetical protein
MKRTLWFERYCPSTLFFLLFSFSHMSRNTGLGMGYLHSDMTRSLTSAGACHIITRLAARSLTGHTLPMQVHQHYGYQFHLVLRGSSCLRRVCRTAPSVRRVCTQLERGLQGLHSCVFDDTRVPPDWVEPCLRAQPLTVWNTTPYYSRVFRTPDGYVVGNVGSVSLSSGLRSLRSRFAAVPRAALWRC